MNVLDLFSGIGGFSLGLERAGMRTVAFCEIDPFCRRVLAKHWPNVPCYDDVRTLTAERLWEDHVTLPVDVICGGFPCQDISLAGAGAGLAGERSGLWKEYARIVGEFRPSYVIVENVAALLGRGLDRVLGDLAALGYDVVWHCIPASAVGAPHQRDRIWITAADTGGEQHQGDCAAIGRQVAEELSRAAADAYREQLREQHIRELGSDAPSIFGADSQDTDAARELPYGSGFGASETGRREPSNVGVEMADAGSEGLQGPGYVSGEASGRPEAGQPLLRSGLDGRQWSFEPAVGRVANGIPSRVDRLRCLGNAVVPQIPEIIGRAIMSTTRVVNEQN